MKIECDKCAAKYSIADEKVRGKTFKIRCKKCSNVIIVRDKGAAAAAAGASPAAAVDHAPGWHLAINGETVGPMAEDEVRQRYDAGEIDKETAVWQEGFEDWVPLGDVEVFASLPDRAAAAAEDPFASANQDDYAAPAAVGAGAAIASAAAAPMEQAHSPRVSQLTGQRNENSVLFSLDSLQALATSGGGGGAAAAAAPMPAAAPVAARAAANPAKGLATSAPSSEGSGLIDIRALGAMVGGGGAGVAPAAAAAPHGAADDAGLPSFGGGGLGGLTAAPLVAPQVPEQAAAVAAAAPVAQPRSQAPLYIMMVFLLLAVFGLVAFVVLREPETKIVKETVTTPGAAPSVTDSDKDKDDKDKDDDEDKDKDKDKDDDKDKDKDDGEDDAAKAAEDAGDDEAEAADPTVPGKKKKSTAGKKKSSGSKPAPKSSGDPLADALGGGGTSSKPKPKSGGGDPGIDCILDPSKCGSGSKKKSSKPKPSANPNLPEKLTSADIKKGVAPHKAAAKSCGGKHGGTAGEKVTVKLSISGSTGKVTSSSATGKHAGTALGNCVAKALKSATFTKFQKSSLGVQYPIRL